MSTDGYLGAGAERLSAHLPGLNQTLLELWFQP